MVELCQIDTASHVLDVGCGVGAKACYLAKTMDAEWLGGYPSKNGQTVAREGGEGEREGPR